MTTSLRRTWVLLLCLSSAAGAAEIRRYDGERIVRVTVRDAARLEQLLALTDDVWSHEVGVGPLEIRVDGLQQAALDAALVPYEVLIDDVQAVIDEQALQARTARGLFDQYLPISEIDEHLALLAASLPPAQKPWRGLG